MAYALRAARQGRARRQPRRAAAAAAGVPRRRRRSRSSSASTIRATRSSSWSAATSTRTGVDGPRARLRHQHRSPPRQRDVRRAQLVRPVGRGLRRDGVRPGAASSACRCTLEIATHVYVAILTDTGSFHYSNITPRTFDICRQCIEAGVESAGRGAQHLRQQQPRPAEAVRRGAEPDAARRDRPHRDASASTKQLAARVRRHLRGHRRADQPAADREGNPGGRVLQGERPRRLARQHALEGRHRHQRRRQGVRRRRPQERVRAAARTATLDDAARPSSSRRSPSDRQASTPGTECCHGRRPRRRQAAGPDVARRRRGGAALPAASGASATPARSIRWPPACCRSPADAPRGSCDSSPRRTRTTTPTIRFGADDRLLRRHRRRDQPHRTACRRARRSSGALESLRGELPADAAGLSRRRRSAGSAPTRWRGATKPVDARRRCRCACRRAELLEFDGATRASRADLLGRASTSARSRMRSASWSAPAPASRRCGGREAASSTSTRRSTLERPAARAGRLRPDADPAGPAAAGLARRVRLTDEGRSRVSHGRDAGAGARLAGGTSAVRRSRPAAEWVRLLDGEGRLVGARRQRGIDARRILCTRPSS